MLKQEEYSGYAAMRQKRLRGQQKWRILPQIIGWLTAGVAFLGGVLPESGWFSPYEAGCLIMIAVIAITFDRLFAPLLDRFRAAAEFEERDELREAVQYTFFDDGIKVSSSRIEAQLKSEDITAFYENGHLLAWECGEIWQCIIPKRVLSDKPEKELLKIWTDSIS